MSRKANPTLIGAFVLGALALTVVTTLLLSGGNWFGERRQHGGAIDLADHDPKFVSGRQGRLAVVQDPDRDRVGGSPLGL